MPSSNAEACGTAPLEEREACDSLRLAAKLGLALKNKLVVARRGPAAQSAGLHSAHAPGRRVAPRIVCRQ